MITPIAQMLLLMVHNNKPAVKETTLIPRAACGLRCVICATSPSAVKRLCDGAAAFDK